MRINGAAWFLMGAAIGSASGVGATYIYMKDKFEQRLTEEVNGLKAHYLERDRELAEKNEQKKKDLEDKIFSQNDLNEFVNYTNMYKENVEEKIVDEVAEPDDDYSAAAEIISDVEWEDPDFDDYRKVSVDYFEDDAVFETLSGESVDGFELIAGDEWKNRFGEYTPNVVYVRNNDLKIDYEIIEQEGPHPRPEDE